MSARALPLSVLSLSAVIALSALPLLAAGCGDDGPECVIDTDCALGQRCGAAGRCEVVGQVTDAGGGADAGARDSGVADSGPRDAGPQDGGDAGDLDAATCAALPPGVYTVQEPFVGCTFTSGSQVRVRAGTGGECSWLLESIGSPVVDGEITIDADATIAGPTLMVSGLGTVACEGAWDATMSRITLSCPPSDCVIVLAGTAAAM